MKIPLFDIDSTLIEGGNKAHRDSFDHAFRTVYGLRGAAVSEIETDGMIDKQILLEVCKLHGISEELAKEKIDEAVATMGQYYFRHQNEGLCTPMRGALSLLRRLKEEQFLLGLLTGNIEIVGWQKVERAGMKSFFSFGSFGDLAYRRPDLIPIAKDRAEKILGASIPLKSFIIVGDSPLDIACAKAGGIQVIAVAGGRFSFDELTGAGADLVLNSLEEEEGFFAFIQ